jgi:hypothetical protein
MVKWVVAANGSVQLINTLHKSVLQTIHEEEELDFVNQAHQPLIQNSTNYTECSVRNLWWASICWRSSWCPMCWGFDR